MEFDLREGAEEGMEGGATHDGCDEVGRLIGVDEIGVDE